MAVLNSQTIQTKQQYKGELIINFLNLNCNNSIELIKPIHNHHTYPQIARKHHSLSVFMNKLMQQTYFPISKQMNSIKLASIYFIIVKLQLIIQNLNQNIILNIKMTAMIKGLFRWSLEITGVSIIWYNYQTFERQQNIVGIYHFIKNSYRTTKCFYGLSQDFKVYQQNSVNAESLKLFRENTARRIKDLCAKNLGAYARIAQVISGYTDIVPNEYINEFKKLEEIQLEGQPYANIKSALISIFNMDTKEMFDGFQTKPLKVGLFTQSYKAVLLQNYREVVVKLLLPSTKLQAQHDIWFINQIRDYSIKYLNSHNIKAESYQFYTQVLADAEEVVRSQLNLQLEFSNANKNKQLMYESNSAFYVPYYFKDLYNDNVIIKQFVEGVKITDVKGLKQIGLIPEVAYAYVLNQVHHLMKKFQLISGSLKENNILIRKYVKPYKTSTETLAVDERKPKQTKKVGLIHPSHQVVFLSQNNFQQIEAQYIDRITSYWTNLKKEKKRVLPSVASFYERLPNSKLIKSDVNELKKSKYYLYEPLLSLYERITKKTPII